MGYSSGRPLKMIRKEVFRQADPYYELSSYLPSPDEYFYYRNESAFFQKDDHSCGLALFIFFTLLLYYVIS